MSLAVARHIRAQRVSFVLPAAAPEMPGFLEYVTDAGSRSRFVRYRSSPLPTFARGGSARTILSLSCTAVARLRCATIPSMCPGADTTTPAAGDSSDEPQRAGWVLLWAWPARCPPPRLLLGQAFTIGRSEDCEVRLEDSEVSRRHAWIELVKGTPRIRDLGSRNGTFVDGQRVAEAPLVLGSVVRVGASVALVAEAIPGDMTCPFGVLAPGLLGSGKLAAALTAPRRGATTTLPVIIEGATGTGKERIARAVHDWSLRRGPLVAVNCGAVPEALAEAHFFGHKRGAFTGAEQAGLGFFRTADGGTLLLDEVAELSPPLQTKLLRVLEEEEVLPVGDCRPVPVDVRVISTAHEPLSCVVARGAFRPDLFARLAGISVRLPTLWERREDIPQLFAHFLSEFLDGALVSLEPRAVEKLLRHPFPLNVRELRLLAHRVGATRSDATVVRERDLQASWMAADLAEGPPAPATPASLRRARRCSEASALAASLAAHGGNVTRAAKAVGMSRQRAYRLLGQAMAGSGGAGNRTRREGLS